MTARWRQRCVSARCFEAQPWGGGIFASAPVRRPKLRLKSGRKRLSKAIVMSAAPVASRLFVPPYPRRPARPRGSLSTLLALQRNPIELWCEADFERPVSVGRTIFGLRGAAHDPAAVRRIFLDNAVNYRKDDLQLRILRPGLGNGLLTAEGEDWRFQRRALAPLFSPRQI